MKKFAMATAVLTVLGIFGCTTMTPQQQGTVSGAAFG